MGMLETTFPNDPEKAPFFTKFFLHDLLFAHDYRFLSRPHFSINPASFLTPGSLRYCPPSTSRCPLPTSTRLPWAVPAVQPEEFLEGGQIWLQIISLQHTLASENQILFVIWFALPALCHSDGNADGFQACRVEERTRFS